MNQLQDDSQTNHHPNPKHKDSLFRLIFSEKKDLLDLYIEQTHFKANFVR